MFTGIEKPEVYCKVFISYSPRYLLRQCFPLSLELTSLARMTSQWTPRICSITGATDNLLTAKHGCCRSESGPHAYMADTLPTEPSPQLHFHFSCGFVFSSDLLHEGRPLPLPSRYQCVDQASMFSCCVCSYKALQSCNTGSCLQIIDQNEVIGRYFPTPKVGKVILSF